MANSTRYRFAYFGETPWKSSLDSFLGEEWDWLLSLTDKEIVGESVMTIAAVLLLPA